jgi:hypothetical protein
MSRQLSGNDLFGAAESLRFDTHRLNPTSEYLIAWSEMFGGELLFEFVRDRPRPRSLEMSPRFARYKFPLLEFL